MSIVEPSRHWVKNSRSRHSADHLVSGCGGYLCNYHPDFFGGQWVFSYFDGSARVYTAGRYDTEIECQLAAERHMNDGDAE